MFKKGVFIIAEAGVNHNGRLDLAKKLIDAAKIAGADAVKFQTWKKGELTGIYTKNVDYIKKNSFTKSLPRHQISNSYQLSYNNFIELKKYSLKKKIIFNSTPDGFESLNFVNNILNVPFIKIGSTELNHHDFLFEAAKFNKTIILSTGMSNLNEVKSAVNLIKQIHNKIIILHCTTEYPTSPKSVNISALNTLKNDLSVQIGYSDHTINSTASIMAVALGAKVIEKHLTLDNSMEGPDHSSSLNPTNFKSFVNNVKDASIMIGSGIKKPTLVELKNIKNIRRGAVASKNLTKGSIITKSMIIAKRPFIEIDPNNIKNVIGRKLKINLLKDQPILWKYLV